MSVPMPYRESMLEVADYLEALVPSSGILGAMSLRAVSKILRERAPEAAPREPRMTVVAAGISAQDALTRAVREQDWRLDRG